MGRKIPGKKHRGVKDPFKQEAKRHAELETKINAPPKNAEEQAVPRSLERVVKLKEAVKSGKITKIKKKKNKKYTLICVGKQDSRPLHPKAKPEKVVPVFQQKLGESGDRFLHRINRATHAFINETLFERKYDVQVNRNPETGKIEGLLKCEETNLDKIEMLRMKHRNIRKKKKKKDEAKMTKSEKRKGKLKLKKQKQMKERVDEFNNFKDQVKFGEVAHEPPQLKVRSKYANASDRSGKRRNLPLGERRQLEKQQSDAIATYRMLKVQRSPGVDN